MCLSNSQNDSLHFCLCHAVWPDAVPAPRMPVVKQSKAGRWYCICPNCHFYVGGPNGLENVRAAVSLWQACCRPGDPHIQMLWLRDYADQGVKPEGAA